MENEILNQYPKKVKLRWRWDGENNDYITYQNPQTGAICILNPVGASIFNYSDGSITVDEIITKMMEEYDVPSRDYLKNDVTSFITEFSKMGIIMLLSD